MPLLQKIDRLTVITVIGGTEVSEPSAEQLVRNLRCNWIGAELKKAEIPDIGRIRRERRQNCALVAFTRSVEMAKCKDQKSRWRLSLNFKYFDSGSPLRCRHDMLIKLQEASLVTYNVGRRTPLYPLKAGIDWLR